MLDLARAFGEPLAVTPSSTLAEVLRSHRVVVTVGSGGVGKTTTAAALASYAAMNGQRVLCMTIDPAKRLANSLGLKEMTSEQQDIGADVFVREGLIENEEEFGALSAMMLDTKKTFDALVRRHAKSPESAERILKNRIYGYVSGSLAGTQEYMAMEKLHAVRQESNWDLIVLDTPPTANALDFLDAPERMVKTIDSPAMRWFVSAFQDSGKMSFNLVGKGAGYLFKALSKFAGVEFLEQVSEFVISINELFGGFSQRAKEVSDAFRGDDVSFVLVTSTDPLAIREAQYFGERLDDAGMRRCAVVVNGVREERTSPTLSKTELLSELKPHFDDPEDALVKLQRSLADEQPRAEADQLQTQRVRSLMPNIPCVTVPAFDEDVHDLKALGKLAAYLVADNFDQ